LPFKKRLVVPVLIIIIVTVSFYVGFLYPSSFTFHLGIGRSLGSLPSTPPTGVEDATIKGSIVPERMVVYTAYISLETEEISEVMNQVRRLAESSGGYVAGSSISSYGMGTVAEITIRIPKDRFHDAVEEIEGYGKVLDSRTTSDDVTQQYIDLRARLENLKIQEESLRAILDLARSVDEILSVQRELERVRGEIESLQGQVNYLEQTSAMSSITVRASEPLPPFTPPGMDWGETLQTALAGLFAIVRGLVILTVSSLPLVAIAGPLYLVHQRRRRRPACSNLPVSREQ